MILGGVFWPRTQVGEPHYINQPKCSEHLRRTCCSLLSIIMTLTLNTNAEKDSTIALDEMRVETLANLQRSFHVDLPLQPIA